MGGLTKCTFSYPPHLFAQVNCHVTGMRLTGGDGRLPGGMPGALLPHRLLYNDILPGTREHLPLPSRFCLPSSTTSAWFLRFFHGHNDAPL